MSCIRRRRRTPKVMAACAAAATVVAAALPAGAQEHFDVLLYEDSSGELAAGAVDVDTAEVNLINVLEGELLGDTTAVTPTFVGEDPGFFSFSDTAVSGPPPNWPLGADNLLGSAAVTLDFLVEPTLGRSLSYWDGSMWVAPGVSDNILIDSLLDPGGTIDGGISEVLDLALADTNPSGSLDAHPDYTLSTGSPTGVYLAYGQAEVAGYGSPSNPFWIVFGTLDECEETETCDPGQEAFNEAIELQIEDAIDYTFSIVPEPSTGLLLALGILGLGRAGSRRHV